MTGIKRTSAHITAVLLATCIASASYADIIASQNFDAYTSGTELDANSWTERDGDRSWLLVTPSGNGVGNSSSNAVKYAGSTGAGVYKTFDSPAAIPAGTTSFYISFQIRPYKANSQGYTYGGALALWNTSSSTNDTYVGPFFGVSDGAAHNFFLRSSGFGATTSSTLSATYDHWYELRLQITLDTTTVANSTGTLYFRDLTLGETDFQVATGLENINLGFSSNRNPLVFTSWRLKGGPGAEFDNLEFGTGAIAVPEAATVGLLLPVGGFLLSRGKR